MAAMMTVEQFQQLVQHLIPTIQNQFLQQTQQQSLFFFFSFSLSVRPSLRHPRPPSTRQPKISLFFSLPLHFRRRPVGRQGSHKMTPEKPEHTIWLIHGRDTEMKRERGKSTKFWAAHPSGPHPSSPHFFWSGPRSSDPTLRAPTLLAPTPFGPQRPGRPRRPRRVETQTRTILVHPRHSSEKKKQQGVTQN